MQAFLSRGNEAAAFEHLASRWSAAILIESRWAVKEATYKAFGGPRIDFRDIRVGHSSGD